MPPFGEKFAKNRERGVVKVISLCHSWGWLRYWIIITALRPNSVWDCKACFPIKLIPEIQGEKCLLPWWKIPRGPTQTKFSDPYYQKGFLFLDCFSPVRSGPSLEEFHQHVVLAYRAYRFFFIIFFFISRYLWPPESNSECVHVWDLGEKMHFWYKKKKKKKYIKKKTHMFKHASKYFFRFVLIITF